MLIRNIKTGVVHHAMNNSGTHIETQCNRLVRANIFEPFDYSTMTPYRYCRQCPFEMHRLYVEGNKGGDYIELTNIGQHDNMVNLKVGHCCVHMINIDIPVEILTAILTDIIIEHGSLVKAFQAGNGVNWPPEMVKRLLTQAGEDLP